MQTNMETVEEMDAKLFSGSKSRQKPVEGHVEAAPGSAVAAKEASAGMSSNQGCQSSAQPVTAPQRAQRAPQPRARSASIAKLAVGATLAGGLAARSGGRHGAHEAPRTAFSTREGQGQSGVNGEGDEDSDDNSSQGDAADGTDDGDFSTSARKAIKRRAERALRKVAKAIRQSTSCTPAGDEPSHADEPFGVEGTTKLPRSVTTVQSADKASAVRTKTPQSSYPSPSRAAPRHPSRPFARGEDVIHKSAPRSSTAPGTSISTSTSRGGGRSPRSGSGNRASQHEPAGSQPSLSNGEQPDRRPIDLRGEMSFKRTHIDYSKYTSMRQVLASMRDPAEVRAIAQAAVDAILDAVDVHIDAKATQERAAAEAEVAAKAQAEADAVRAQKAAERAQKLAVRVEAQQRLQRDVIAARFKKEEELKLAGSTNRTAPFLVAGSATRKLGAPKSGAMPPSVAFGMSPTKGSGLSRRDLLKEASARIEALKAVEREKQAARAAAKERTRAAAAAQPYSIPQQHQETRVGIDAKSVEAAAAQALPNGGPQASKAATKPPIASSSKQASPPKRDAGGHQIHSDSNTVGERPFEVLVPRLPLTKPKREERERRATAAEMLWATDATHAKRTAMAQRGRKRAPHAARRDSPAPEGAQTMAVKATEAAEIAREGAQPNQRRDAMAAITRPGMGDTAATAAKTATATELMAARKDLSAALTKAGAPKAAVESQAWEAEQAVTAPSSALDDKAHPLSSNTAAAEKVDPAAVTAAADAAAMAALTEIEAVMGPIPTSNPPPDEGREPVSGPGSAPSTMEATAAWLHEFSLTQDLHGLSAHSTASSRARSTARRSTARRSTRPSARESARYGSASSPHHPDSIGSSCGSFDRSSRLAYPPYQTPSPLPMVIPPLSIPLQGLSTVGLGKMLTDGMSSSGGSPGAYGGSMMEGDGTGLGDEFTSGGMDSSGGGHWSQRWLSSQHDESQLLSDERGSVRSTISSAASSSRSLGRAGGPHAHPWGGIKVHPGIPRLGLPGAIDETGFDFDYGTEIADIAAGQQQSAHSASGSWNGSLNSIASSRRSSATVSNRDFFALQA